MPLNADALCGSGIRKSKNASENKNPSDQCVFTSRSHFAAIHRHEHYDFMTARIVGRNDKYAAQKVTVKGTLQGEILTVESVSPAK